MLCSVATLIHDTYLPVYLKEELGLSNSRIGNLQAAAQFLSKASGTLSGTAADLLSPSRMVVFGTLLTTVNKPMFAAAGAVYGGLGVTACLYWITFGKIFDRVSKGIREAPSKALIGDLAAASGESPAAAFSLRQSLSTAGALVGSGCAALAFRLSRQNYVVTFALSCVPAACALALVSVALRSDGQGEKAREGTSKQSVIDGKKKVSNLESHHQPSLVQKLRILLSALPPAYWQALAVVSLLYFARFDASFVTLRASAALPRSALPWLTSLMMIPQALLATSAGLAARRSVRHRNAVLLGGIAVLVAANACFALPPSRVAAMAGALLVGVHMALTHGVSVAMLASYIPTGALPGLGRVAGTAWSFTDAVLGVILAYSNALAGRLADASTRAGRGGVGCFYGGAVACVLSMLALAAFAGLGSLGTEEAVQKKQA
ncbi:hypothetical protein H632_c40p0 [Helicosporidium sp. ATCC 50920]|nr:hypothetical protein H632_c40p0 [Helicosporidium sp. ATCC 50920]|eukprot:KDD77011.1 hypothetical protein H632_c40p0 [Helicosporidium sp. ATCC 50920]